MNSTESEILQRINNSGVIAVLVIDRAEDTVPLAQALLAGRNNDKVLRYRRSRGTIHRNSELFAVV